MVPNSASAPSRLRADYTESLVSGALGLRLQPQSRAGFDALAADGARYQIKGRRLTARNGSTQLGALRNLDRKPFDLLAAVVYSEDLTVLYGAVVPIDAVMALSRFSAHSNSHVFMFRRAVLEHPGVVDITAVLSAR